MTCTLDDVTPATREAVTLDGQVIGLPCVNVCNLLLYRRDLLDRHGLSVPQSWTELRDVAARLQAAERARVAPSGGREQAHAGRQLVEEFGMEADVLDRTHDLVAGVGEQVQPGVLDVVESQGRRISRSLGCGSLRRSLGGHGGGVGGRTFGRRHGGRDRGSLGHRRLPGVARGLLHFLQPLRHDFGLTDGHDAVAETVEGHAPDLGGVVLLEDLLVAVIVRRSEQLARDAALVDNRKIALRRLDLDLLHVEESAEIVGQDMLDGRVLGVERQVIRQGHVERGGLGGCGAFGRLRLGALDHDDKAIVFLEHRLRDLKELIGAAGGAHSLHQRGEAAVFRITGGREVRADIRGAVMRALAALAV